MYFRGSKHKCALCAQVGNGLYVLDSIVDNATQPKIGQQRRSRVRDENVLLHLHSARMRKSSGGGAYAFEVPVNEPHLRVEIVESHSSLENLRIQCPWSGERAAVMWTYQCTSINLGVAEDVLQQVAIRHPWRCNEKPSANLTGA